MNKQKNKTYSAEFKQSAVKLVNQSDVPVAETARNLGVNENTLYTWITFHNIYCQRSPAMPHKACYNNSTPPHIKSST